MTNKHQAHFSFLAVMHKIIWLLSVLLGITLLSFAVIHLAPGLPVEADVSLNPLAGEEGRRRLAELYGYDRPILEQYVEWLWRLLHLDFGNSLSADSRPVLEKILERLPLTLAMSGISLLLTLFISVPLGILSACKENSFWDRSITVLVFAGFAMPSFWLALLLMNLFGIDLGWLPISGLTSLNYEQFSAWHKFSDLASHLTLPITVCTLCGLAGVTRYVRACMTEVLRQDYMLTAQAKGLAPVQIIGRHAFRNALLPLITLLGLSVPGLIGGSVIIESVFALPGLGQLFYAAVMARDYPLIMGNLVLGSILTLAGNLLADICYGLADPRIRTGGKN